MRRRRSDGGPTAVRRLDDRTFMCEEDSEIWDSMGRLVARSRQLALLPRG